jgi:hypothetical protein
MSKLVLTVFLSLSLFSYARAEVKPTSAPREVKGAERVKAARELPTVSLKITESVMSGSRPNSILRIRYACEPLRYTAWVISKFGVQGGKSELQFDKQARISYITEKKGPRVIALEDSQGGGERSVIERLKGVKFLIIRFQDAQKQDRMALFPVDGVYKQISDAEKKCPN